MLVIVTLEPWHPQTAFVHVPINDFGIGENEAYVVEDLLTDERFLWRGSRNFVALNPHAHSSADLFRLRRWQDRENGQDVYA